MLQEHLLIIFSCFSFILVAGGLAWRRWRAEPVRVSAVTLSRLNRQL